MNTREKQAKDTTVCVHVNIIVCMFAPFEWMNEW